MSESPTLPTHDLEQRVAEAVAVIRARTALAPRVGITLGSGLGGVVDAIPGAEVFATRDLPHWPASTVQGHAGRLALGTWCGVPVAALSGRSHRYEGYTMDRVTFAVRNQLSKAADDCRNRPGSGFGHPSFKSFSTSRW